MPDDEGTNDMASRTKHPVATIVLLVAAAVGGIATLINDLNDISRVGVCFPYKWGFSAYDGEATLTEISRTYDWRKIDTLTESRSTGDHHCSEDCRDERTRTNYTIDIPLPKSDSELVRELREPKLFCESGPCEGWNEEIYSRIQNEGQTASASFDVWSRPTTWKLVVDVYERQPISDDRTRSRYVISSRSDLTVAVNNSTEVARIAGKMEDGSQFSFIAGQADSTRTLILLDQARGTKGLLHTFKVQNPNCESK